MKFDLPYDVSRLRGCLPAFVELIGDNLWQKRVLQLHDKCRRSPWGMKIVDDYHWLEMELDAMAIEEYANECIRTRYSRGLAALRFAASVVEMHGRLSTPGKTAIEGRLRDSMKSGFPGLFLEMEAALLLMGSGYDVEFPDLQGTGNVDLQFQRSGVECEVECKSQSVDAGRKVHRSDFYRFMDEVSDHVSSCVHSGSREIVHISVADRFPTDDEQMTQLADAVRRMLETGSTHREDDAWFKVDRLPFETIGNVSTANTPDFYAACKKVFGEPCHIAGPVTNAGACLIVAKSEREDDTSKPLLEAMKKANEQLTANRPGFVAIQFNDMMPSDLSLPHLRRRAAILSTYLFGSRQSAHLAAVYFCAYAGLHYFGEKVGIPGFACWNPRLTFPNADLPFRDSYSDDDFSTILDVRNNDRETTEVN